MQQVLRAMIQFAATLALAGVVLGYGGSFVHSLDALGHFRLHLLLCAAVIALVALIIRKRSAAWRATAAMVIALAGLSPLWERPPEVAEGPAISVLTANLHHYNTRAEDMLEALRAADADILVTNETTKSTLSGAHPLSLTYPFRVSLTTRGRILRTVIWSKFPMRDGALFLEDSVEPTGAAAVVQLPDGREITVLGLHLAHAFPGNQDRQIAALGRIAAGLPKPMIVLGDFNASPWSHALRRIETLTGTRRIPGFRVTWHGAYPSPIGPIPAMMGHAIDHVLLSPGIAANGVHVVEIPGSDHNALGALVRLPPAWHGGLAAARPGTAELRARQ